MLSWIAATLLVLQASLTTSDNVGWKSYFTENTEEFHDILLQWESPTPIPSYVTGTFVRNGAARIGFGSKRRVLSSWLEGFAKIHTFKFNGSRVLYSGKMLETPLYLKSVEKGELVPQLTFNFFDNPDDEWTFVEKLKIAGHFAEGDAYDNANPAVWRIGPPNLEKGVYLATTDDPVSTRFDIKTLKTIKVEYPNHLPPTLSGCTHWMREPGTDNSININTKLGLRGPEIVVQRWRPEHTYQDPEVVAKFVPNKQSYFHSFSITENYAVLFLYPVTFDALKFWKVNFHLMEVIESDPKGRTDIYAINLKTGEVTHRETGYVFSLHHANAYEDGDELVVDLISNRFENMRDYMKLKDMIDPPHHRNLSEPNNYDFYRFNIGLQKDYVRATTFEDVKGVGRHTFTNHFEFPTINENYRGKKYCILYGWSSYQQSRQTLVKRNLCNDSLSRTWNDPKFNHYSTEMSFVPNPAGKSEDDGVLVTNIFDGASEKSYLMVFDAKTFTPLNKAWLPHAIPYSFHGMYFPEAQF